MISPEQQETLTRIGPGTKMGALLRRYWVPVAATCEIHAGEARRVRVLGEDLVLFRATTGRLGLVDERCPHRGASLHLGVVDHVGIRCPYHGWKFDGAGRCLETPAEPSGTSVKRHARVPAHPVEELGGLVFAYLGPAPAPVLPRFDVFAWPNALRDIGRALLPCNWLQIMENSVDPHHVEWLHGHHLASVRKAQGKPVPTHYRRRHVETAFDVFEFGILKRRLLEGGSKDDDDWRVGHPLVFPLMLRVGAYGQDRMQIRVPVDDTHTMHYWYACYRPPSGGEVPTQDEIPVYEVPWRDTDGAFRVDFVDGQDVMTWVTQGPIADRTREVLGHSDRGIVLYRRLLLEQMRRMEAGEDPLGVLRDASQDELIELPQERDKYAAGAAFLAESISMGHARYSPIREQVLRLMGAS